METKFASEVLAISKNPQLARFKKELQDKIKKINEMIYESALSGKLEVFIDFSSYYPYPINCLPVQTDLINSIKVYYEKHGYYTKLNHKTKKFRISWSE